MEQSLIIKTSFFDDKRRFTLKGEFKLQHVLKMLSNIYPSIPSDHVVLKYQDDEGDMITICNEVEFQDAVKFIGSSNVLNLQVSQAQEPILRDILESLVI